MECYEYLTKLQSTLFYTLHNSNSANWVMFFYFFLICLSLCLFARLL